MGQRRISETILGATDAGEILGMAKNNVAVPLTRDLGTVVLGVESFSPDLSRAAQKRLKGLKIELKVDSEGSVQAQTLLIGGVTPQRAYSHDWVQKVARQRASDPAARAVDDKRRKAARARKAA